MSTVIAIMSMSLDGFVADPNDGVDEVFEWYFSSGDVEFHTGGSDPMTFRVSEPSAIHLRAFASEVGAMLTGRRTFDVARGWNGNHGWGPAFVLTHGLRPPRDRPGQAWQPGGDPGRGGHAPALSGAAGQDVAFSCPVARPDDTRRAA